MRLQFAFQGGGAKLAELIAVADGVYAARGPHNFTITKLAGASAGAVAAAILATGVPPQLFADKLRAIGPAYERKIFNTRSVPVAFGLAALGMPILNRSEYANFLHQLFEVDGKKFHNFSNLALPLDVVSTDLVTRSKHVADGTRDDSLMDALMDSSALPFFLHTHRDRNDLVDGGLVNNLPVQSLVAGDGNAEPGLYSVAITFYDDSTRQKSTSLRNYVASLVSTVIDYNVAQSLTLQRDVRVHTVYSKTSLLDFKTAIEHDLSEVYFQQQRASIMKLIEDIRDDDGRKELTLPVKEFAKRLQSLQDGISKEALPRAERIVYRWTCQSLRQRTKHVRDTCKVEFDLSVEEGLCWSFSGKYSILESPQDMGNVNVIIQDRMGESVPCTVFPLTPELLRGTGDQNNLFIFFHRPLRPGDQYTVQYEFLASEVLFDLSSTGEDAIEFAARGVSHCSDIKLVVFVPEWIGDLEMLALAAVDGPDPMLVDGNSLTRTDLDLLGTCPVGFRPIGWGANDVALGFRTGFVVRSSLFLP